jgi:hypothetical protein
MILVHKGTIRRSTAAKKNSARSVSGEDPSECILGRVNRAITDSEESTVGIVDELKNVVEIELWL